MVNVGSYSQFFIRIIFYYVYVYVYICGMKKSDAPSIHVYTNAATRELVYKIKKQDKNFNSSAAFAEKIQEEAKKRKVI